MLEAFTGAALSVSIVTGTGCSLAAWEKIAAGRAWRPLELATFTVRAGIGSAFLDVDPFRVSALAVRWTPDRHRTVAQGPSRGPRSGPSAESADHTGGVVAGHPRRHGADPAAADRRPPLRGQLEPGDHVGAGSAPSDRRPGGADVLDHLGQRQVPRGEPPAGDEPGADLAACEQPRQQQRSAPLELGIVQRPGA